MKISFNWLSQYISLPETAEELAPVLTNTGLEVEQVEARESIRGGLQGLIVGRVITCSKHPNADKLSLTTVNTGEKIIPVICGASNVAAGQKVIVALPGAMLYPTGGEPFRIKASKIRGEISEGMICAEDEIGIGQSHEGILVLNTDLPNGTPAATYFNCTGDYIFEIGLTPNRADAASHLGVARDLKAALNREIRWPDVSAFKADDHNLSIDISVESEACPRYSGLCISGVTVQESPPWLKQRLEAIGLKPINNLVDITNFVLHETGQPLHAFDADKIAGKKIVVKTLPANTPFTTLDGKERKLSATDLMICDAEGGLCIAGVLGGLHSGISDHTQNIFLESAYFSRSSIRRTGIFHQIKTDASFRFERGTDPNLTVYALKRAALLIKEIGGKISSDIIDIYPQKIEPEKIEVPWEYINRLIGKTIPREEILSILKRLDFEIDVQSDHLTVLAPSYRVDVLQPADVVEEILRIYGFNQIELSEQVGTGYLADFPQKDISRFKRTIGEQLAGQGFYEIVTNSLTHIRYSQKYPLSPPVEIINKLSEEHGVMRQTLLFQGLEVCSHNINRRQKDLKLFEFGKIYGKSNEYWEEERLAIFMTGLAQPQNWQYPSKPVTYYDLANQVANVLEKSGLSVRQESKSHQWLDYGSTLLIGKKEVGFLGKLKPQVCRELGIKQEVFYADLCTQLLFQYSSPKINVKEVPQFPEVRRDISLVLDKKVTFSEIKELIRDTEKNLIKDITTFDVYEGGNLPEGKKAYALGLILWDAHKTMTDKETDEVMNRLMAVFEEKMNALIRK